MLIRGGTCNLDRRFKINQFHHVDIQFNPFDDDFRGTTFVRKKVLSDDVNEICALDTLQTWVRATEYIHSSFFIFYFYFQHRYFLSFLIVLDGFLPSFLAPRINIPWFPANIHLPRVSTHRFHPYLYKILALVRSKFSSQNRNKFHTFSLLLTWYN